MSQLPVLLFIKFIAHPQVEGDEPNHTVEQEQCKFAFSIIVTH